MNHLCDVALEWGLISLLGAVAAGCSAGGMLWRQLTRNKRQDAMLLALGQYVLMCFCEDILEKGTMSLGEWTTLVHLYESYQALGGNGIVAELYEKCQRLKIRKDG